MRKRGVAQKEGTQKALLFLGIFAGLWSLESRVIRKQLHWNFGAESLRQETSEQVHRL
ncbi:hypothetical protein Pfo_023499 [Paulownia fortunei]|nr:hypothetical protein Pfo_023499 [Paulownia fortunei]